MPYSDLARPSDVAEAMALLTRFPVPVVAQHRGARAAWAWPLAGALGGLCGAVAAALALWASLPPGAAAALALCAQALATGALHEDGLADCADGLWGGATRERRLEIMRDSRIGSFGALALVLSVLLRWTALSAILATGAVWGPLLAAGALSRWPMVLMLWALPPAREGGLSRLVGRPATGTVALSGGVALALGLLAVGWAALPAALAVAALALLWTAAVRRRLRGQTGDTCGAAQQLGEVAALLALAA
jgi:adenosylcobinamide-GDP ribazoletransferase